MPLGHPSRRGVIAITICGSIREHNRLRLEGVSSLQPTPGTLSSDLLHALHEVKSVRMFPKGATLFEHGSAVTGVYLVESGEVRVLLPTGPLEKQLLEVVGPGTMLGLSESMTGGNLPDHR